jgi:hypothetical protein
MDDTNESGRGANNVPPDSRESKAARATSNRAAPEMRLALDELNAHGASNTFRNAAVAAGRLPFLWPRDTPDPEFANAYEDAGGDPNGGQYAKDLAVFVGATWRCVLKHVADDSEFALLVLADVSGSDTLRLGTWLVAYAEAFTGELAATARAVALARAWSGPAFADQVRRVAAGTSLAGDDRTGALLALAAARSS